MRVLLTARIALGTFSLAAWRSSMKSIMEVR